MSEQQIVIVVSLFVFITASIAISIALDGIWKRLRNIERILTSTTKQDTGNENEESGLNNVAT